MINTTYIDQKYIRFLSGRLRSFRDKGNGTFEFSHSCESTISKKRRGFFYKKGDGYNFFCHNCQESTKFFTFLQKEDALLYKDYRLEVFKESMGKDNVETVNEAEKKIPSLIIGDLEGIKPYSSLPDKHPAWKYVKGRQIPEEYYGDIYFCANFYEWAAKFNSTFEKVTTKEPRLVLPYRNRNGDLIGFSGRAYGKSLPKYVEIKLNPDTDMIFGVDRVNTAKAIIAVEGQIDSMFLDNAIAAGGASYKGEFFTKYKHNIIVVPDNDWKRNIHVLKQIEKLAAEGYKIALLPDSFKAKDINKAVTDDGMTKEELTKLVHSSVKSGPELILDIAFRRKC